MADRRKCRHCRRGTPMSRGLCWRCFYTPQIRQRYPKKRGEEAIPDRTGNAKAPSRLTGARPGTSAKLAALIARAAAGRDLWHNGDGKVDLK